MSTIVENVTPNVLPTRYVWKAYAHALTTTMPVDLPAQHAQVVSTVSQTPVCVITHLLPVELLECVHHVPMVNIVSMVHARALIIMALVLMVVLPVAAQRVAIAHQNASTALVCALTTISCVPAEGLQVAAQRVEIAHQNASAVCVHVPTTIRCALTEEFQAAARRVAVVHQNALAVTAHVPTTNLCVATMVSQVIVQHAQFQQTDGQPAYPEHAA
jgi:hypothetical protein